MSCHGNTIQLDRMHSEREREREKAFAPCIVFLLFMFVVLHFVHFGTSRNTQWNRNKSKIRVNDVLVALKSPRVRLV